MELIVTIKQENKTSKHNVICLDFIQGIEDFCYDFGIKFENIVSVVVIDE